MGEVRCSAGAPAETRLDCSPPMEPSPSPEQETPRSPPVAGGHHCSPTRNANEIKEKGKLISC